MKNYVIGMLFFSFIFSSCKEDKQELRVEKNQSVGYKIIKLPPNRPNLNISILLDLSDRINPVKYPNTSMDYYVRDIGYIKSIAESFEIHLRNKRSIKIDDNLQLFIDPEPSDKSLNEKIEKLKMSFTKDNAKKNLILKTSKHYDSISKLIYESAINDNKYVGSDIWNFFKNKVNDYCIEKDHRNILIILTDGYIYHKDSKRKELNLTTYLTSQYIRSIKLNNKDWKNRFVNENFGFLAPIKDYSNLEVLVLGVNPDKKNPYEDDVIKAYWEKWFTDMKVKHFEIKNTDLPSNMEKIIRNFIFEN
jgi:hypothetical protein